MNTTRSHLMRMVARILAGERFPADSATAKIIAAGLIAGVCPLFGREGE